MPWILVVLTDDSGPMTEGVITHFFLSSNICHLSSYSKKGQFAKVTQKHCATGSKKINMNEMFVKKLMKKRSSEGLNWLI
jgi:hypothetical protein